MKQLLWDSKFQNLQIQVTIMCTLGMKMRHETLLWFPLTCSIPCSATQQAWTLLEPYHPPTMWFSTICTSRIERPHVLLWHLVSLTASAPNLSQLFCTNQFKEGGIIALDVHIKDEPWLALLVGLCLMIFSFDMVDPNTKK